MQRKEGFITLREAAQDMRVSYEHARQRALAKVLPATQDNNGRWWVPEQAYHTWRAKHPEQAYVRLDMISTMAPNPQVTHLKRRANAQMYHATHDSTAQTQMARDTQEARFKRAVDPTGKMERTNPALFHKKLALYKTAYFTKLRLMRNTAPPVSTAAATVTHEPAQTTISCAWCWRRENPRKRFPRTWQSRLCGEHAEELALKESIRQFDLSAVDDFDEAS